MSGSSSWLAVLVPHRLRETRRTHILAMAGVAGLLAIGFDLVYGQAPLYSSNQVHHLLYGLADSGRGFLENDWLARTADPAPVVTFLVSVTAGSLHENLFYVFHALLLGVYAYSAIGIAAHLFRLDTAARLLTFIVGFAAIHASFTGAIRGFLTDGVAQQYVLGTVFQPSVFGVFLVLSLYLWLRGRAGWSVAAAAAAGTFHPTYLIASALLTAGYALTVVTRQRDLRQAALLCGLFAALVAPIVVATSLEFWPAADPVHSRAQEILVNLAVPHHALPSDWFRANDLLQLGLVLCALFLVRGTSLFPALSVLLGGVLALTGLQVATDSDGLALLFPWRPSVVLVPVASTILLGWAVARGFDLLPTLERSHVKPLTVACAAALVVLIGLGARDSEQRWDERRGGEAMMAFVERNKQPGDVFAIPVVTQDEPEPLHQFRVETGAPVFVDFKARAYEDHDVLEWYRRWRLGRKLYRDGRPACEDVRSLIKAEGVTGVIVSGRVSPGCPELVLAYQDPRWSVWKSAGASATGSRASAAGRPAP